MTQPITTERTSDDDFAVFRETEHGIQHVGYVAEEPSVETLNAGAPAHWIEPTPAVPVEVWVHALLCAGPRDRDLHGGAPTLLLGAVDTEESAALDTVTWNGNPKDDEGAYRWSRRSDAVRFVRADEVQRLIETAVSVALAAAARAA